jgi:predicted transcriptional regulator
MRAPSRRLNVTLDPAYAIKLGKLAERTHVNEGTLARSLLSQALDEVDPDPRHVAALLDGLPGALKRAHQGLQDANTGRTVDLDDL